MHKQLNSSFHNLKNFHNSKANNQPPTFHIASFHDKLSWQAIISARRRLSNKEFKQKLEAQTSKVHKKIQWNLQA